MTTHNMLISIHFTTIHFVAMNKCRKYFASFNYEKCQTLEQKETLFGLRETFITNSVPALCKKMLFIHPFTCFILKLQPKFLMTFFTRGVS